MKIMKTICQSMAGLAASTVLALGIAESAEAFTLITDPNDSLLVTGIKALDIGGTLYDVEFEFGAFNDIYDNINDVTVLEGDTPLFWDDRSGAEEAVESIMTALSDTYASGVSHLGLAVDSVLVPWGGGDEGYGTWVDMYLDDNESVADDGNVGSLRWWADFDTTNSGYAYALFTKSELSSTPVPEPASTVAILAVAGTGLLATRKGKK